MTKSMIAPFIALASVVIGGIWHISLDENEQNAVAEACVLVYSTGVLVWGIYKNHRKEG